MVDFAKRPEVTVSTMGKLHNPTGEGVRAISNEAKVKAAKHSAAVASGITRTEAESAHDTKVGKEGTAKRNIIRKKTADIDSGNYNSTHKKQGGHGKGQWKDAMDPTYVEDVPIDEKDPLYNAAEDLNRYILSSHVDGSDHRGYDPQTSKSVYGPMLTNQEFKVQVAEALKEYFDSCDADEVIRTLEELGCQEFHHEIVKKAISLAMDNSSRERELTSRLLTCLHPTPLSMEHMEAGFNLLLDSVDDLSTDVPEAETMVASFLARAVVDEVLPPAYLSEQNNVRVGDMVIAKAVALLSREHCTARLERVWGPGDGRPVEELKIEMDQLLQEYLHSRELDEAARCVKELHAPHFHHELVKRGAFAAMELDGKKEEQDHANLDAMAALLAFLVKNAIVSEYQVKKGLSRLKDVLPDMQLDVPLAPALMEAFAGFCAEQGCLPVEKKVAAEVEEGTDQAK
ncbi:predicted protein [Phaeodactylum tricornutum CCAP 1055/1]|uniref:MI domain-containing protein n=2 Tax=Phaeodactylum tricornutum TaxID=2850 RepID=B7GCR5_PHATC|nr:predicted protein [Phaeodactylum tricornutum CCAP 1055/1]EEC43664.1 predicted protein [Phaeodactylum tricornutum CCAP 1055/1]|eukprot:XP_002184928.1 predicted protein [Phaeodactylum tricornutum CCAP 1055/1]